MGSHCIHSISVSMYHTFPLDSCPETSLDDDDRQTVDQACLSKKEIMLLHYTDKISVLTAIWRVICFKKLAPLGQSG